jgi:hypothetical protein
MEPKDQKSVARVGLCLRAIYEDGKLKYGDFQSVVFLIRDYHLVCTPLNSISLVFKSNRNSADVTTCTYRGVAGLLKNPPLNPKKDNKNNV